MRKRLLAAAAGWCAANELGWVLWDYLLAGSWLRGDIVSGALTAVLLLFLTPWHLAVSGLYRFFVAMFARHGGTTWRELYEEEVRACGVSWFREEVEI